MVAGFDEGMVAGGFVAGKLQVMKRLIGIVALGIMICQLFVMLFQAFGIQFFNHLPDQPMQSFALFYEQSFIYSHLGQDMLEHVFGFRQRHDLGDQIFGRQIQQGLGEFGGHTRHVLQDALLKFPPDDRCQF